MDKSAFFKKMFFIFVMIQAGITLIMGIVGTLFVKGAAVPYVAFFFPFFFAALCMIPEVLFYTEKELSARQVLMRKGASLVSYEVLVLGVQKILSPSTSAFLLFAIGISIILLAALIQFIIYLYEKSEADKVNKKLAAYRSSQQA